MSIASRSTAARWVAAVAVTGAVIGAPAAYARLPVGGAVSDPAALRALITQARASTDVGFVGLAEARGTLGLPDLPRLGDVAALLGGTTRAREWWENRRERH